MTTATMNTTRPPARHNQINLLTVWRNERLKIRRFWFFVGAMGLGSFAQLLGVSNYQNHQATFVEQNITWLAIWGEGAVLVTKIFLPLLYIVIISQAAGLEYQTRGWQRLASLNRTVPAVFGKQLAALEIAVIGLVIYTVATIVSGLALGFDPSDLPPYILRAGCGALGAWALSSVTLLIGTYFRSFAVIATVGVAAVILGMGMSVLFPAITTAYPYSLIAQGLVGQDFSDLASPIAIIGTAAVSLVWVAISTGLMCLTIKHREW